MGALALTIYRLQPIGHTARRSIALRLGSRFNYFLRHVMMKEAAFDLVFGKVENSEVATVAQPTTSVGLGVMMRAFPAVWRDRCSH